MRYQLRYIRVGDTGIEPEISRKIKGKGLMPFPPNSLILPRNSGVYVKICGRHVEASLISLRQNYDNFELSCLNGLS